MSVQEYTMMVNSSGKLEIDKIFAQKGYYRLNEKHVIMHLYNWMLTNKFNPENLQIEVVVKALIFDFYQSPAFTVMKLDAYAKHHFHRTSQFLKAI